MTRRLVALVACLLLAGGCGSRAARDNDGAVNGDGGGGGDNDTCAGARQLTISSGYATASGDTTTADNEFGTSINCGLSGSTVLRGPQRYYKVALKAGKGYKFSLSPDYSYGRLYVFRGCGAAKINADCGSGGKTGAVMSQSARKNGTGSLYFSPAADGTYYVAVDSTSATSGKGTFILDIEEFDAPSNNRCKDAQTITLSGGKASVKGTTAGAANEFGTGIYCGSAYYTYKGPQAYYKVGLQAGKSYIVSLDASYSFAYFYIFGATCTTSAINTDCGSDGKTGDVSSPASSGKASLVFTAAKTGSYTIAVDSTSESRSGTFTLEVKEFTPPTNGKCATPKAVDVSKGGKVQIKGTTFGAKNEYGDKIKCAEYSAVDGPQAYYRLTTTPGTTYKFSLTASFTSARMYIFGTTCDAQKIESECASKGQFGDYVYTSSYSPRPLYFKAGGSSYTLAVDSTSDNYAGDFTLDIEEFTPPANGTCSAPKPLTFSSGKAVATGDTSGVPNEYGTSINCGNYKAILYGNQLYYRLSAAAGKSYSISLSPDYSAARFYVFSGTCTDSAINKDCSSAGISGLVSSYISKGKTGTMTFKPAAAGDYVIAVDGTSNLYFGSFTLTVTES